MYNCCKIYAKDFHVVYDFVIFVTSAMKTITSTFEGMLINLHLGGLKRRLVII